MQYIHKAMAEQIKQATLRNVPFWVCLGFSIALLVAGFLTPPLAKIDGSILTGVGELFGFAALWTVWHAILKGVDAKVQHGKTSVTVGNLNDAPAPPHFEHFEETETP